MASMTFQVNDASTSVGYPAVWVTISENADGTLSFTVTQEGGIVGDLRGLFFDLNNESVRSSLTVTGANTTEFRTGDDSIKDLGDGANMNGLLGSDKGYDAGIEIGSAGIGKDDIQSYNFTLSSSARALTLQDFANVDFGVRLTSVGTIGGSRSDSSKIMETTSAAIDARDDSARVDENDSASGNVLANDVAPSGSTTFTGWTGGGGAIALANAAGTMLTLNADGSWTLDASAADALSEGEHLTYSFTYSARNQTEATSWSDDSATFTVRVDGKNDGPVAGDDSAATTENTAATTGSVLGNDEDIDRFDTIGVVSWSGGALGNAAAITNGAGATVQLNANGTYVLDASAADALSEGETIEQDFTYTLSDNHGATDTAILKVTVTGANDGPVAGDDSASTAEDTSTSGSVLDNDSDIDRQDILSVGAIAAAIENGAGATLVLNTDGSYTLDATGADALSEGETIKQDFTYTLSDNHGGSTTAVLSVAVTGVNDGPVAEDDNAGGITESQTLSGNVTGNDSDVDRLDTHTWSLVSFDGGGNLTFNDDGTWSYDADGAYDSLNNGDHVNLSFQYAMNDNHDGSDSATVSFRIDGVSDVIDPPPPPPPTPVDPALDFLFNHGRAQMDHGFFPQTLDKDNVVEGFTSNDTLKIAGYGDLDSMTVDYGNFGYGSPNVDDTKFQLYMDGNPKSTRTDDVGYLVDYTGLTLAQIDVTSNTFNELTGVDYI